MAKKKVTEEQHLVESDLVEKDPYTKLELNGKSYSLVYDYDSIVAAEDAAGIELLVGVNWQRITARRLRAMLYSTMLKAQPDITLAEIGKLITHRNVPLIEIALVECWVNASQEVDAPRVAEAA